MPNLQDLVNLSAANNQEVKRFQAQCQIQKTPAYMLNISHIQNHTDAAVIDNQRLAPSQIESVFTSREKSMEEPIVKRLDP